MKINEMLEKAIALLKNNNIEEPILKSKIILAHCLNVTKEYILINGEKNVSENEEKEFFEKINKVCSNIPLQYITNKQEFMGLEFYVDNNVLIPRCDTEILVEKVIEKVNNLQKINKYKSNKVIKKNEKSIMAQQNNEKIVPKQYKILDMCTGSGAIAISLAKMCENVEITAVDKSEKALNVAIKNYEKIKPANQVKFIESNMFENLKKCNEKYDIIVSNPPYIETETVKKLEKSVQNEPNMALDGGTDGLDFYKIISQNLEKFLKKDADLFLEIGYNQKESVSEIFKNKFEKVECIKDYAGNDRVIIGTKLI